MKIAALTLSLVVSTTHAGFQMERDLQACPASNTEVACTMDMRPVKCGGSACEYNNQCLANAAGWTPGVCWPATCDMPPSDMACTMNSNPVLCGDSKCEYANYCTAEAAGFPPTVCEAVNCPQPPGLVACSMEYDPFVCLVEGTGLCTYSNGCFVSQSGLNVDPNGGSCMRTPEFIANKIDCPPVGPYTVCTLDYDPVRCGPNECLYANSCEATSVGFDTSDPFTCQFAGACPAPDDLIACPAIEAPVICQPEQCVYGSMCHAVAAGFLDTECVDATCPIAAGACTREYNPQTCTSADGATCSYDNPCMAEAAGMAAEGCTSDNDPESPETCAIPDANTVCTMEVDEKLCGDDDCFYSNQCLATAAGYTTLECRNINCPASPATLEDCGDFEVEAVLCGPYQCPYLSSCTANRARWTPQECTPVSCPAPPATTACTLEYAPIVCASAGMADGVPCPYSNSCLAQAAGYDTAETAGQCITPLLATPRNTVSIEPLSENVTATDATDTPAETPAEGDTETEAPAPADDTPEEPAPATDAPATPEATEAPAATPAPDSSAFGLLTAKTGAMALMIMAYFIM